MDKLNDIIIDKNFNLSEFECQCCKRVMIHSDLLKLLVKLRRSIGQPILVNSGYRCKPFNKQVGGHPNSYHLYGMAADIYIKNYSIEDLAVRADIVGFTGIGIYDTFIHVDVRPDKERWDNRT